MDKHDGNVCRKKDAEVIFANAKAQNMTGEGYAWIVTEQVLIIAVENHGANILKALKIKLQNTGSTSQKILLHDICLKINTIVR